MFPVQSEMRDFRWDRIHSDSINKNYSISLFSRLSREFHPLPIIPKQKNISIYRTGNFLHPRITLKWFCLFTREFWVYSFHLKQLFFLSARDRKGKPPENNENPLSNLWTKLIYHSFLKDTINKLWTSKSRSASYQGTIDKHRGMVHKTDEMPCSF